MTNNGLTSPRRYTTSGMDPFKGVQFTTRASRIGSADGTAVFEMAGVEVPESWDQVATDILASKYFRKAGVPQTKADGTLILDERGNVVLGAETSVKQVALRLANAWRIWGVRGGYFASDADADAYRDEMAYMIVTQMAAPNSPQWFNTGLSEAYNIISDPDGSWFYDEESGEVKESAHRYERSAASACYISLVEDKLIGAGSIFEFATREARLFSQGSGSGANFSHIRATGEKLSGGGTSSGVMSFLSFLDRAAGAIKSGGTTRRAAKMVILDADHPEIESFIWSKVREEEKVKALRDGGFDASYEGEAYQTVAYQNANHSVRIPRDFMNQVATDGPWQLKNRTDGKVRKEMKARDLWSQLAEAAWRCADPGVQFDDTLNDWNTAADTEPLRGSNPCSEYTHVDNTACNLASLNLGKFFSHDKQEFDTDSFAHAVRLWTLTLEITVSMAHYPDPLIAARSYEHRTLGLGYANMGAMLMRAGLAYDSAEARAVVGAVTSLMHNLSYSTSAEVAQAVGACKAFEQNRSSTLRVLRNHRRAAYGSLADRRGVAPYENLTVLPGGIDHMVLAHTVFADLSDRVTTAADKAVEMASMNGLRNMQVTVLAPTGTIGLVMSCDTTGIEPDFALVKMKKLAGGGYMRITNSSVLHGLRALGYKQSQIDSIEEWMLGTKTLDGRTAVSRASLVEVGFTDTEVDAAAAAVSAMSDLTWAFAAHVIGEEAYTRMKLDPTVGGSTLLKTAGFSYDEITASSKTICGHLTVEGAPDMKPEHLAVFDCAVECGDGTRVIHWSGHVRALGAASPHLSGAISKTINMPNSVSVDEVQQAYELAYQYGVKAAALYRDGCKMSQPLNSAKSADADTTSIAAVLKQRETTPGMSPREYYEGVTPPRFRPPNPRFGPTWRLEIGGEELYLRANTYEDGSVAEVFLDWGRQGSTLRGVTSALSIVISHALQRGMPLEDLVKAFRGHTFEPHGIVTGHDNLKMASSVIDAMARILGHQFLGRDDLVQKPAQRPAMAPQPAHPTPEKLPMPSTPEIASPEATRGASITEPSSSEGQKVYGQACSSCGGTLIQAGACLCCSACGTSLGCS